ncbi:polyamine-modulated factor 1 [Pristis pectinata]|uniref:polyamine-modulated factor 1 n=1 Tax=Pristis pectinata TaxID=685728 RepID=UPI00223CF77B|nr:polyamine-modulated factor 1 [Pristis pectinata]
MESGAAEAVPVRGPETEAQSPAMGPESEAQAPDGGLKPGGSGQGLPPDTAAGAAGEAGSSKRLRLFSVVMETMVEKLLETASFERFTQCYKPVHEIQPQFTHSVYKQLVSQLQTSIREEINQISEDGLFERALPKLDQLERESEARMVQAWRPTGAPAEDLRAHLVPCQLQQRQYLQLKLKRAREENTTLAQEVLQGRRRVQDLQQLRDDQCQAWEECNCICQKLKLSWQ